MAGTLYVVATPIGNLEDLTFRALRILKEVDLIAAEDTRRTSTLLAHYEVRKSLVSLREHNEVRETPRLIERLSAGVSIALVSDAGTPGIADPGARFVSAARSANIPVVPVPGPSAVAAALSISGFNADEFVFMGFPPRSGREREDWISRVAAETRTIVFFEAPHRIRFTLRDLAILLVDRPMLLSRELSKIHETSIVRPINASAADFPVQVDAIRGEFTVVIEQSAARPSAGSVKSTVVDLFGLLIDKCEIDADKAIDMLSIALNEPASNVRRAVRRQRYSVKRP